MQKIPKLEDPLPSKLREKNALYNKTKFSFKSFLPRLFGRTIKSSKDDAFYETIKQLKANAKNMASEEKEILTNFLKFGSKTVEDVMIPRSDIAAVKFDISLEELNQEIINRTHTRTLIYDDTLDSIIGFIHIKDLFKVVAKKQNFQLKKIMRKPIVAAPSMKLIDLLAEMQQKRTHIAIVIDEYGGTDGIVTIEDIMEEIVGRIDDEHDKKLESDSYKIINSTTILSSSRVEVEDLEKILGVRLKSESDEFDTIGGLVLAKAGSVPLPGTIIEISDDVALEVIDASPRTLKQVKLKLKTGQLVM